MLEPLEFVDFYGEPVVSREHFFYGETLPVRSAKHSWKINLHRHSTIHQLFLVTEGGGEAELDGQRVTLEAPCLLSIPDGQVHGFQWQEGSTGMVLSVSSTVINELWVPAYSDALLVGCVIPSLPEADAHKMAEVASQLMEEENHRYDYQDDMILAKLKQLMILVARVLSARHKTVSGNTKSEKKLNQFKRLIQQHGANEHQVGWYADKIGVSSAHLNQICQQQTNNNALSLIHRFLIAEAKRYLVFADVSIAVISDRLGFNEPAYFSRFFRKQTGVTPAQYRLSSRLEKC